MIATDPPFNTGRDFHATTPEALKKGVGFQDRWTWDEEDAKHQEWVEKVKEYSEDVYHVIEGSRKSYGDDMGAFLCFMGARLLEMQRILKDTGSIYLHCDPTASHYLKELMDAVFGRKNFRNEIIWSYQRWTGATKHFQKMHDVILFYAIGEDSKFNILKEPYSEKSKHKGARYSKVIDGKVLEQTYTEDTSRTKAMRDVWEISYLNSQSKERTGYPTQKPVALYKRIIEASSNPGDVVLDPFCGCATTCVAAELLGRQWIGIDLWEGAYEIVENRIKKDAEILDSSGKGREGTLDELIIDAKVNLETKPPMRTDDKELAAPYQRTIIKYNELLAKWQKLPTSKIREYLAEAQRAGNEGWVVCAGCGRELEEPFMELDHIMPKKDRRIDDISNRILICKPCNQAKSYKLSISGLRDRNKKPGKNGKPWMHDEVAAIQASDRAEEQVNKVKRKYRE